MVDSTLGAKTYPKFLHMYRVNYIDGEYKVLYACGMTHAYAMSKECWSNQEIQNIIQLDDSWKN